MKGNKIMKFFNLNKCINLIGMIIILLLSSFSSLYAENSLGENLLKNPGAEEGIEFWTVNSNAYTVRLENPPPHSGNQYFFTGANIDEAVAYQEINLNSFLSLIENSEAKCTIEGYMRNYQGSDGDISQIVVQFLSDDASIVETVESDKISNNEYWVQYKKEMLIPKSTVAIRFNLISTLRQDALNNGYFDDLSFIIDSIASKDWIRMKHSLTTNNINAVWGSSENDIFAVGDNHTILHFDGNQWARMHAPYSFGFPSLILTETLHLISVWGISEDNIYAVGNYKRSERRLDLDFNFLTFYTYSGRILHYDGDNWSETKQIDNFILTSINGSSNTEIYVTGYDQSTKKGKIYKKEEDGDGWTVFFSFTNSEEYFNDMFLSQDMNSKLAVGKKGIISFDSNGTYEYFYNAPKNKSINSVFGLLGYDFICVGDNGFIGINFMIPISKRYVWNEMQCTSNNWKDTFSSYFVGSGGNIGILSGGIIGIPGCKLIPSGTLDNLNGIWSNSSSGPKITIAVGDNGTILRKNDHAPIISLKPLTSSGWGHAIALKLDGTVWAWGGGNSGCELGIGETETTNIKKLFPNKIASKVVDISSGSYHSVILKSDNSIWTWGKNEHLQTGIEITSGPQAICEPTKCAKCDKSDISGVSTGLDSSFAIENGFVWAWGSHSRLGAGKTDGCNYWDPQKVKNSSNEELGDIIDVRGMEAILALKNDGTIWAWGNNICGMIGDATTENRNASVQVKGGESGSAFLSNIIAIASGRKHSLALRNDGTVWSWGVIKYTGACEEQGCPDKKIEPIQIMNGEKPLSNICAISAWGQQSYALQENGDVWGWGSNYRGQLGINKTGQDEAQKSEPEKMTINEILSIESGYYHALAIKKNGSVWFTGAWGTKDEQKKIPSQVKLENEREFNLFQITENTSTIPIRFIVSDVESDFVDIDVSATSSNQQLVSSLSGFKFEGSGRNRSVTITPKINTTGRTIITLTASDGKLTSELSFQLKVTPVVELEIETYYRTSSATVSVINNNIKKVKYNVGKCDFKAATTTDVTENQFTINNLEEGINYICVYGKVDDEIWQEEPSKKSIKMDSEGPSTEVSLDAGFYKNPINITLNCTDKLSGCSKTYYKKNNMSSYLEYNNETITIDETSTFHFYSEDNTGNREYTNTKEYTIDKENPKITEIIKISITNKEGFQIECSDTNGISGVHLMLVDNEDKFLGYDENEDFKWKDSDSEPIWLPTENEFSLYFKNFETIICERPSQPLSLTAKAVDFAGNISYFSTTYDCRKDTIITCNLNKNEITIGESITITGTVQDDNSYIPDLDVNDVIIVYLNYQTKTHPDMLINDHYYYQTNYINSFCQEGDAKIYASYEGNNNYKPSNSTEQTLKVNKAKSQLKIDCLKKQILQEDFLQISGSLNVTNETCSASGSITLIARDNHHYFEETFEIQNFEPFKYTTTKSFQNFEPGEYTIQAFFSGNASYSPCESNICKINVIKSIGYAIIVQGHEKSTEGDSAYSKTTNFVYNSLLSVGFHTDNIAFIQKDKLTVSDDQNDKLTVSDDQNCFTGSNIKEHVKQAITCWAPKKISNTVGNLHIIMVDHGGIVNNEDVFHVYNSENSEHSDNVITANELSNWITDCNNTIGSLSEHVQNIVILGFCQSGNFIDELSGKNRIIISSSEVGKPSNKGPFIKDVGLYGEFFIYEFFKQIRTGQQNLRECFSKSAFETFKQFEQQPLLDDNNDGIGNFDLSRYYYDNNDGFNSQKIIIGSSEPKEYPSFVEVTETKFLSAGVHDPVTLWAQLSTEVELSSVWFEIITPGTKVITNESTEQIEYSLTKHFPDKENGKYVLEEPDGLFNEPGKYKIKYYAYFEYSYTDTVIVSSESVVYKNINGNVAPECASIIFPAPEVTEITPVYINLIDDYYYQVKFYWLGGKDSEFDDLDYIISIFAEDAEGVTQTVRKDTIKTSNYLNSYLLYLNENEFENFAEIQFNIMTIDLYGNICNEKSIFLKMIKDNGAGSAEVVAFATFIDECSEQIQGLSIVTTESISITNHYNTNSKLFNDKIFNISGDISEGNKYLIHFSAPNFANNTFYLQKGFNDFKLTKQACFETAIVLLQSISKDDKLLCSNRYDKNNDKHIDLSDAIILLQYLSGSSKQIINIK
jgi:alpha-tubulin suppressor-like RCC1 family protein